MEDPRAWTLAEQATDDGLSLTRIKQFERGFDFRRYPERLNLIWAYQDDHSAGTASAEEMAAMERFEDRVCERIEAAGHSVLAIVFTEPDHREYVFHTRDVNAFIGELNAMPQEATPYPIEIDHESDPKGEFYRSFADAIGLR
ncbi:MULTISPECIES: DUF695 domain-containing protein [unclassified Lysobacter]|uniref:DUF695 domain-containing protein n=1 Tax=unclassified Lysobacter TaxID=2635362 RepID=UPI001BEBB463|nr:MULTISPECIES: DUF695 domain-containing protein [unclassified Lysobacter]MBT2748035.1 DUF695 domain-containing protein [Lysobacter sp. ISL-42]MBT2752753.1 DUF695 domain-containing protein [Lysobacter sp. ISL-50]MBT2779342.1 DUF695 domain-containing protein [Lysobacter sp. ISL-54]MBT2781897.1 DUF695 domain-containing protein [Lysobacter sp. ISL-52]